MGEEVRELASAAVKSIGVDGAALMLAESSAKLSASAVRLASVVRAAGVQPQISNELMADAAKHMVDSYVDVVAAISMVGVVDVSKMVKQRLERAKGVNCKWS